MGMSQGTYTFLACFAGFWLIWAAVVLLCCFCSFLQRRLKRHREESLREAESMSCPAPGHARAHTAPAPAHSWETAQLCSSQVCPLQAVASAAPLPLPQANWVTMPTDTDFGKPPCYEEAVQMEDPPPPYSEVLADPRGGTYLKPGVLHPAPRSFPAPCTAPCSLSGPSPCSIPTPCSISAPCPAPCSISIPCPAPCSISTPFPAQCSISAPCPAPCTAPCVPNYALYSDTKPPPVFSERGYSSLIRLPSSQRWDSLGYLLSNMDLNHNHLTPPSSVRSLHTAGAMATMPRRDPRTPHELRLQAGYSSLQARSHQRAHRGLHRVRGLEQNCGLPTTMPLLGRSTAV